MGSNEKHPGRRAERHTQTERYKDALMHTYIHTQTAIHKKDQEGGNSFSNRGYVVRQASTQADTKIYPYTDRDSQRYIHT